MEVLLTCDESETRTSVNFWNPVSGTKLLSLRGPPAHPHSLSMIRDEGLLVVETGKPFIHFWQAGHPLQTSRRILCPGKPGPAAMSPNGNFLAVAIEEKINLWQVSSGRIVTVINSAHYRPVTVLKWNHDGTYLLSAGVDGMVLAWKFISLVSGNSCTPKYSWSDHSFPVADIHIGFGGAAASVFTVSSDRTSKIYSLVTGTLTLSVSFPHPLTAVVVDAAETALYVGANNGSIYQMKLHSRPRSIEHHISSDPVADYVFKKHTEPITTLAISADGRTLASGDEAGIVLLWDTHSKQAIKTFTGTKHKITNILFWLGNPENLKPGGKKPRIVFPEVPKLVEIQEQNDGRSELERIVMVWNRESADDERSLGSRFVGLAHSEKESVQVAGLKAQLVKSEAINKKLHAYCIENIMNESGL